MHPTAERLTEAARVLRKIEKPAELARALNISQQTLKHWENRGVSQQGMLLAEQAIGVRAAWLKDRQGAMKVDGGKAALVPDGSAYAPLLAWEHPDELPPGDFVAIPRMEVRLSAGPGAEQTEFDLVIEQPHIVPAEWIRSRRLKPDALRVLYARGNSMEPRIYDGDALVVDLSQTSVIDGRVFALYYDAGDRVKRLTRRPGGGLIISSDNEREHPVIALNAEEASHVRIIGRIVNTSGHHGL